MKKFDFPLGRVERWFHQQLSLEQAGMARIVQEISAISKRIETLENEMTRSQAELQEQQSFSIGDLQAVADFIQRGRTERNQLVKIREQARYRLEAQRHRVGAKHRQIKVLETLRLRRRAEWEQEYNKELDMIAGELHLARVTREMLEN